MGVDGALNEDVQAADLVQKYEARMTALERLLDGRKLLEIFSFVLVVAAARNLVNLPSIPASDRH